MLLLLDPTLLFCLGCLAVPPYMSFQAQPTREAALADLAAYMSSPVLWGGFALVALGLWLGRTCVWLSVFFFFFFFFLPSTSTDV
jgi:hypothetical protein